VRAILIHNPNAGTGRHTADGLIDLLKQEGVSASYHSTLDERYRDALRHAADLVIAAGGDGTIAKVADALGDREVPVAIIPLGTANNIACSLQLPSKPKKAVRSWRTAAPRDFDIGSASGPWGRRLFLEATGAGAFAEAVAALDHAEPNNKKPKRKAALKKARRGFQKILQDARPAEIAVVADGEALPDDLLLIEVMNTTHMGPRLRLAEAADSGDGRLDVVFLPRERRDDMLDWLKSEDSEAPPPVSAMRARRISIEWNGTPLRIGDAMAPEDGRGPVSVELEPECLKVLVPTNGRDEPGNSKASGG
jgi:diacylglycerol kinase family enzyme